MLPAKHTAGLASCKYLIVLHCTVKCAQLRVCIVAVKYGIWLHWKRCIVCVWGRQKVFHNCLWQATGHRPWSFGRLDFHCFKCQAYGDFFLQPDWRPSRLIWTTVAKKRSFELVPWNGPSSLYLQCHATTLRNWYQIAALFHCWGSFQVCSSQGLQYHTLSRNCTEEAHSVAILHGRPRLLLTMSSTVRSVKSLHNASLITEAL